MVVRSLDFHTFTDVSAARPVGGACTNWPVEGLMADFSIGQDLRHGT
jgi:hypothetical protein